jgi:hypothetical protein
MLITYSIKSHLLGNTTIVDMNVEYFFVSIFTIYNICLVVSILNVKS